MRLGKNTFEVRRIFFANTILVAFFKILYRSLFFDVEKRRQCSEVRAIASDILKQICSKGCLKTVWQLE